MDTTAIATAVTGCLAPALPYLIKAGEKGAETLGEKLGSGVWEKAKALWQMLSPVAETHPSVATAAREMAEMPDDADAQAALRFQLKKLLTADEQLAAALMQLLESAEPPTSYRAEVHGKGAAAQGPGAVAAGKGGVATGGDVHGGVRIGGTEIIGTAVKQE